MPPKPRVEKEDIIKAAADIVRENGVSALNARAVAARLGVSTQPIFSNYGSMEELKADVLDLAYTVYAGYLERGMSSGQYPVYKASGMAYIQFAKEERELFKLLFMRDRTDETSPQKDNEFKPIVGILMKNLGLTEEEATMFHLEMWVYVHGIAAMIATSYLEWDEATVSRMLTDLFAGLKIHYRKEKE
ncbi:MAG: TetR/AcrR family transcriptional regulator [Ruminococcus sp.]|nr:TetR/AcrR family transcriptional regulator [Ruminococcus sp.]MCM1381187.1 TetR/AcrR family transcriptional regulator [Muribaculaceae bacterium]MCM1480153.1 TetR/AcrR family transcriptional regulator [Muribaculaceae bacterium]